MTADFREPFRGDNAARFRWHTQPGEERAQDVIWGRIHREFRGACGLTMGDVARVHGVPVHEVSDVELGRFRFADRRDLWAALNQLWLMRRGEP